MKNITIILGPKGSGKQEKAREIAAAYQPGDIVFLRSTPRIFHSHEVYFFAQCTPQTKLLVVSNMDNKDEIFSFIFFAVAGIYVNAKMKEPFLFNPDIVLVCHNEITYNQFKVLSGLLQNRKIIEFIDLGNIHPSKL